MFPNRRLRVYGSAEPIRPRAHATAHKSSPPSLLNATSPGLLLACPAGEVLARLRRSIRKPCRRRFAGSPTPTAASPLSSKSRHCRGTGFSNAYPPGVSPGVRIEPPRRRQQSSLVFDFRQAEPPPCRADHSRVKQQIFLTYREQGPCPVNPDFRIIEHGCTGCTGLTGRAAGAQDADWLNNGLKS